MFIHIQSHVLCFLVVSSVHQVFNIFIFFPPVLFVDIETLFLVIIDFKIIINGLRGAIQEQPNS